MQRGRPHYYPVAAGFDTIEVNAYGELRADMPAELDALQAEAVVQRDARHGRQRSKPVVVAPWAFCGQPLMVAPHGVGQGQYQWMLTCPFAVFRLSTSNMNKIGVKVRLGSDLLWHQGYRQAWAYVKALLDTWGAFTYQPSEAHQAVDVAGSPIDRLKITDFTRRGHVVRWHQDDSVILDLPSQTEEESTTISVRYGEMEGLAFSPGSPHSVVLYNKPREIRFKSHDKAWFGDIWREHGWNDEDPVTRIEARYKREWLHEFGVESMEDLFSRADNNWQYSTQDWLRHTRPTADKTHSRWPTTAWWHVVQRATFERQDAAPSQREHVRNFHEQRMLSTILGYIESWAAWHAHEQVTEDLDISTVLRDIARLSNTHYEERETEFLTEVLIKRKRIGYLE